MVELGGGRSKRLRLRRYDQESVQQEGLDVFVSSRRRHTMLVSDWSSDVCSSDLFPSPLRCTPVPQRWRRVISTVTGKWICSWEAGSHPETIPIRPEAICYAMTAATSRTSRKIGRASCRENMSDEVRVGTEKQQTK